VEAGVSVSARLEAYVALERVMLELDAANDSLADRFRDLMDPIWYGLSDDEVRILDGREVDGVTSLHPICLSVGHSLFVDPAEPAGSPSSIRDAPVGFDLEYAV